jgi:hypothetical protein
LVVPEAHKAQGIRLNHQLKEFVMNDNKQTELAVELPVVDLGDAKALTQGIPAQEHTEENQLVFARKL